MGLKPEQRTSLARSISYPYRAVTPLGTALRARPESLNLSPPISLLLLPLLVVLTRDLMLLARMLMLLDHLS